MPDWSYRTLLRPIMLGMGPERARRLAVFTLGTLSRHPLGLKAIDFLGHMRPNETLAVRAGNLLSRIHPPAFDEAEPIDPMGLQFRPRARAADL